MRASARTTHPPGAPHRPPPPALPPVPPPPHPALQPSLQQLWARLLALFTQRPDVSDAVRAAGGARTVSSPPPGASSPQSRETEAVAQSQLSRTEADTLKLRAEHNAQAERSAPARFVLRYGGPLLREAFWQYALPDYPDAVLVRFLRARSFDVDRALGLMCEALSYWYELDAPSILRGGEAALHSQRGAHALWRHELGVVQTVSKEGFPVMVVHVGRHSALAQSTETMHQHMLLSLMSALACSGAAPPDDASSPALTEGAGRVSVVFNMAGFTIRNMDWQAVLFSVRYMTVLFPERIARVWIHASPWVFRSVWQMLQPMVEPIRPRIRFSSSLADLAPYLAFPPELAFPRTMGGQADKFSYPPPLPREAEQTLRADIRQLMERERDDLAREFEATTACWSAWIEQVGDEHVPYNTREHILHTRFTQQVQLRLKALQARPFERAPSLYHRLGILAEDGSATFRAPNGSGLDDIHIGTLHAIPALISWLAQHGGDLMTSSYSSRLGACGLDRTPDMMPSYASGAIASASANSSSGAPLNPPSSPSTTATPTHACTSNQNVGAAPTLVFSAPDAHRSDSGVSSRSGSSIRPPSGTLPPLPTGAARSTVSSTGSGSRPRASSGHSVRHATASTVSTRTGASLSSPPLTAPSTYTMSSAASLSMRRASAADSAGVPAIKADGVSDTTSSSGLVRDAEVALDRHEYEKGDFVNNDDGGGDGEDINYVEEDAVSDDSEESETHAASVWPDYIPRHKLTKAEVMQSEEEVRTDVAKTAQLMDLFLNSKMTEAEAIARPTAGTHMYMAIAMGLINAVKAIMTFEKVHLETGFQCARHAGKIAKLLRKKRGKIPKLRMPGRAENNAFASMTYVEQQAELIYSESHLITSVVGIFMSREATSLARNVTKLRRAYLIIRQIEHFCQQQDEAAEKARLRPARGKRGKKPEDFAVDVDLRCGMQLSFGLCTLVLSLLPALAGTLLGRIGYSTDRERAMAVLCQAGGWSAGSDLPAIGNRVNGEGMRRPLCDITILTYHLFIRSYVPIPETDLELADKVLQFNLERYPEGFFYLFFQGRMLTMFALPERAMEAYRNAITCQKQYRELSHLVYWDLALSYLTLADHDRALECFDALSRQSSFTKALFQYAKGISLYSSQIQAEGVADERTIERTKTVMRTVSLLCQRVAGQTIGAERFALARAQKFIKYGRLTLPGLEFSYIWHTLPHTPVFLLYESAGAMVSREIAKLEAVRPKEYNRTDESEWAGAYALALFLRGVILRFSAYPLDYTLPRLPPYDQIPSTRSLAEEAVSCFNKVLSVGPLLSGEDVGIVYFSHYELGRLWACMGDTTRARSELKKVVSGKALEVRRHSGIGMPSILSERPQFGLERMVLRRSQLALSLLGTSRAGARSDRSMHRQSLALARYRSPSSTTNSSSTLGTNEAPTSASNQSSSVAGHASHSHPLASPPVSEPSPAGAPQHLHKHHHVETHHSSPSLQRMTRPAS